MDGLINRASALFRDLALSPNDRYPHTLHCIRIHLYEDGHKDVPPDLHRITCLVGANADGCLDRTVDWASIPPPVRPGTRLAGVLRMVILARDDAHAVGVHPGTFSRLFDLFGIDPYMKYLVARSVDGYYTALPRLSAPPCGMLGPDADAARNSRSFYVGVRDSHAMLWSCFPAGGPDGAAVMSAVAVCGAAQVAPLAAEARTFASVVGHPAMPVLACCSRVVQDVDGFVADTLCTLQAVEAATGLSPHAAARCRPELAAAAGPEGAPAPPPSRRAASAESTARLGEMSGWMGEASVKLAQFSHHLGLVRGVVQQIHEPTFEHICNGTVKDVAQLLMETSSMTLDYVQYLAKRVEVQHVVVCSSVKTADKRESPKLTTTFPPSATACQPHSSQRSRDGLPAGLGLGAHRRIDGQRRLRHDDHRHYDHVLSARYFLCHHLCHAHPRLGQGGRDDAADAAVPRARPARYCRDPRVLGRVDLLPPPRSETESP